MQSSPPPAPRFTKIEHHVVPKGWQRRFANPGQPGPFYKNVKTGECLPAQGPGDKMAERYANILFDAYHRPSDRIEDVLSARETIAMAAIDRVRTTAVIDPLARVDLSYFLALQACRYPEEFSRRLDLGRYLAIGIRDCAQAGNATELNRCLQESGLLPGAHFTEAEAQRLASTPADQLEGQLTAVLEAHGYEAFYNPELVLAGALPVAELLLGFGWTLLRAPVPGFIISDRPMPKRIEGAFAVPLASEFAIRFHLPDAPVNDGPIASTPAQPNDIQEINAEVRARALEWICGPTSAVHSL